MDVKVIHLIHELINWFLPIVSKYPHNFRYTLGTRHFTRISHGQKVISSNQYEAFAGQLNKIGKQIGGWKKEREKSTCLKKLNFSPIIIDLNEKYY